MKSRLRTTYNVLADGIARYRDIVQTDFMVKKLKFEEIACVQQLRDSGEVVADLYLGANPDVRSAGLSAQEHFERHGQFENRLQWANVEAINTLRQAKLSRVRFTRDPATIERAGHPVSFITQDLITEFGLPEHPPVSANQYSEYFADEIRSNPDLVYLDVGAGLRYSYMSNVLNTEIYDSVSTDIVCLAEDLPLESDQFDYVICGSVLEHTRRPWQAAQEIIRVLKPGGRMLIDWPFLQAVHGYPHHYFNATPQGVISLFERQCEIISCTVNPNQHPIFVLYWVMAIWRSGLDASHAAAFDKMTVADILATMPDKQLTLPFCSVLPASTQELIGAGSTLLARKRISASPTDEGPASAFPMSRVLARLQNKLRKVLS